MMNTRRSSRLKEKHDAFPTIPRPEEDTSPPSIEVEKRPTFRRRQKQPEHESTQIEPATKLELDIPKPQKQKSQTKIKQQSVSKTQPVRKKPRLAPIKFNDIGCDPIIEHVRKLNCNTKTNVGFLHEEIIDEIALEGLSGMTISRLFLILDAKYPNLGCRLDWACQTFIWNILTTRHLKINLQDGVEPNVKAYYVDPKLEHSSQISSSSPKGLFIDKPISLPLQTIKNVPRIDHSLTAIHDGNVMGSCSNYTTRQDITAELISLLDTHGQEQSLEKLNLQYGLENVFLVANQELRYKTLLPNWSDPNVDIKPREYCTLELIGKFRTLGVVFPKDKTLGRYRLMLLSKGIISQFQLTNSSPIEHLLKRFAYTRPEAEKVIATIKEPDDSDDDGFPDDKCHSNLILDPTKIKSDRSIFSSIYDLIAESDGISLLELRRRLHLPKFHMRNHLKNLVSLKMICTKKSSDPINGSLVFYKTAHKSRRKRKPRREKVRLTGIMANWDEADVKAKRIIGHKRSSFSRAEDSLLILCRIVSLLLDPRVRTSWCVHKRVVRDLLHKELIESHDKTSDACLRRIKYLKRLTNNIMSINELTAELRDDPDVVRILAKLGSIRPMTDNDDNENKNSGGGGGFLHGFHEEKLNRLFLQALKIVKAKIPNLLGLSSGLPAETSLSSVSRIRRHQLSDPRQSHFIPAIATSSSGQTKNSDFLDSRIQTSLGEKPILISSHEELRKNYDLIDCQSSVASISRAPTYERPKNLVDVKFNNACLMTMASILSNSLTKDSRERRLQQHLLDKFYCTYNDRMINSVLSKLNKRSLLSRKCSPEQASIQKPRSGVSLRINQSVHFLLNRYQSSSQMQLAKPIEETYRIELEESNEMGSIAMLAALFSMSSELDLELGLKIPQTVVGIDQGNENFKSLCAKSSDETKEILARFMNRCGGSFITSAFEQTIEESADRTTNSDPNISQPESGLIVTPSGSSPANEPLGSKLRSEPEPQSSCLVPIDEPDFASHSNSSALMPVLCALQPSPPIEFSQSLPPNGDHSDSGEMLHHQTIDSDRALNSNSTSASQGEAVAEARTETQTKLASDVSQSHFQSPSSSQHNKIDDSRRALFLLRHELKAHALDKCGNLSDCLIVQPCKIRFYSSQKLEFNREPLQRFLDQSMPLNEEFQTIGGKGDDAVAKSIEVTKTDWLVKAFKLVRANKQDVVREASDSTVATATKTSELPGNRQVEPETEAEANQKPAIELSQDPGMKLDCTEPIDVSEEFIDEEVSCDPNDYANPNAEIGSTKAAAASIQKTSHRLGYKFEPIEYSSRVWKTIDGQVHLGTLTKLIESILAWIVVHPGIEEHLLRQEFNHLIPDEHLQELMSLMEEMGLISSQLVDLEPRRKPRLFGYSNDANQVDEAEASGKTRKRAQVASYEATSRSFVNFSQLLSVNQELEKNQRFHQRHPTPPETGV